MEASSPLAAMQPTSCVPGWGRSEIFAPHLSGAGKLGSGSFNFRELGMKRSTPDYFGLKPLRGSSPTASLAADLSQNFHIDQSPQLPTPRRSLFTSNLFGTFDGRESVRTPPLPESSSPGPLNEMMDISPLPHKAPYTVHMEVQSPTPGTTPDETPDEILPSSPPKPSTNLEAPRPTHSLDRRKSACLRPNLTRMKNYSTNSMPQRQEGQYALYRFQAGSSKLSTSTSMTLDECFMESPPQERRPQSANSPSPSLLGPPRLKQPFASLSAASARSNSPIHMHNRRQSNPFMRPRKQFRRSLSMFEHPGDIMKGKKEETAFASSNLQSVMDIDEPPHQPVLPHFFQEGQPDSIPRVSKDTLVEVLDGKFDEHFDNKMVVDCRFEYEFEGGHIDGAVNFNDKELMASELFETNNFSGKTLLIFHCEYSAHRAPIMARHVRQQDRAANVEHYPRLTFPEVYILDGGYSSFFHEHRSRCFPQNYVEMDAKEHANTCEREMGKLRQNRAKFGRAHTFALGQHGQQIEDSPTAPSRTTRHENRLDRDDLMLGTAMHMFGERLPARRSASS